MYRPDMFDKFLSAAGGLLIATLVTQTAYANNVLDVTSVVEKEILVLNESGKKVRKRVPAEKVIPGEEVIYTSRIVNKGKQPASDIVITNPVPEHMFYKDNSAQGNHTHITYSADDGMSFASADKVKVIGVDGIPRKARAFEYTHIRWVHKKAIQPGSEEEFSFRATLQ